MVGHGNVYADGDLGRQMADETALSSGWAQSSDAARVGYYAELAAHARAVLRGARLVANPGTICDESYVARKTSDVVCLFENVRGFEAARPPEWAAKYETGRFAAIPYNIPGAESMADALVLRWLEYFAKKSPEMLGQSKGSKTDSRL